MSRLEVFVASRVDSGWCCASSSNSRCLVSRSSRTASTTSADSGRSATWVAVRSRSATASSRAESIRPLASSRCRLPMMRATPSSAAPETASTSVTGCPDMAATWAIPAPIAPAPTTETGLSCDSVVMPSSSHPYDGRMTTATTPTRHPLVEKHSAALDEAAQALAARSYYSRYPESPSPRVYGEGAAEAGKAAHEALLDNAYAALGDVRTDGAWVGEEVSPNGPRLGITYPHLDVDAAVAAALEALPAWRDAGARTRAAVC